MNRTKNTLFQSISIPIMLTLLIAVLIVTPLQVYAKENLVSPPTPTNTPIPPTETPTAIPPTPTFTPVPPTVTPTPLPPTSTPTTVPSDLPTITIIKRSEERSYTSCKFIFTGDNAETCTGYSGYPCTCTINCPSCLTDEYTCTGLSVSTINAICGNSGWKEADRISEWRFYTVVKRIRRYLKY